MHELERERKDQLKSCRIWAAIETNVRSERNIATDLQTLEEEGGEFCKGERWGDGDGSCVCAVGCRYDMELN